jgi:hypothetical protein
MNRLRNPSLSHIESLSRRADVMVEGVSTRNQHGALPSTDPKRGNHIDLHCFQSPSNGRRQ